MSDVGALAGVDQARVDGVGVVVEVGLVVDAVHLADGDVGPLACLQAAGQVAHVDGARPTDGGDLQRLPRRQHCRVLGVYLGDERRQAQLLDHVQVVVAGRAVGAHADLQAELEHLRNGGDTAGELQVARWTVGHARAGPPQAEHVLFIDVDAMGGQELGVQDAVLLQPGDNGHVVQTDAVVGLQPGLADMGVQRHVEGAGQVGAGQKQFRRGRIPGVGGHGGLDERVAVPALDEAAAELERVLERFGVGRGKDQNRLAQQAPQADLGHLLGDGLFIIEHVGEAGDTGANHLGTGHARAQLDEVGRDELTLDGHQVAQPHIQAQVVVQAAHEGHGDVGVSVDKAGHDDGVGAVDGLGRLIVARHGVGRADGDDGVAANGDRAVFIHVKALVHGHDGSAVKQDINFGHRVSLVSRR